jgi:hypothetical protein
MKKLCILLFLLLTFVGNSQNEQPTTKKEENSMLICSTEDRSKWFTIIPHFKKYNGISEKNYLITIKLNIGKCSKRDALIFTFVDGKYMTIRSNIELTCDGITDITFPLNPVQLGVLEMKSIKSIRYVNGNDRSFYLYAVKADERDFFKNLLIK